VYIQLLLMSLIGVQIDPLFNSNSTSNAILSVTVNCMDVSSSPFLLSVAVQLLFLTHLKSLLHDLFCLGYSGFGNIHLQWWGARQNLFLAF